MEGAWVPHCFLEENYQQIREKTTTKKPKNSLITAANLTLTNSLQRLSSLPKDTNYNWGPRMLGQLNPKDCAIIH